MTDVTFTGINPGSIMATATGMPVGQQKAKYCADVVTALGSSLIVEIQVGTTVKYRTTIPTSLTSSADGIALPTQFSEPPTINVADALTTSTAALVIKNATNTAVSLRVPIKAGGGTGFLTASLALNGTDYVRTNGVIFRPPSTLDVGGGGGSSGETVAFTSDYLIASMKVNDESPLYNSPTGNDWRFGGVVVMGADFRFDSTPNWWPANTAIAQTPLWTTFLPWFVVWDGSNHGDNLNCRVAMRDMEFWVCDSDWNWSRLIGPYSDLSGELYRRDLQGSASGADERTESDGSFSVRFNHSGPNVYHGWAYKANNIDSSTMRGIHVRLKARKVVHSSSGTDQRNTASYLIHVGGDPYPNEFAHANNQNQDAKYLGITWLPGAGACRFQYVTNDWKAFCYTNLATTRATDGDPRGTRTSGWTMTDQQLRDNPPPLTF
jgi:hypothetical protein